MGFLNSLDRLQFGHVKLHPRALSSCLRALRVLRGIPLPVRRTNAKDLPHFSFIHVSRAIIRVSPPHLPKPTQNQHVRPGFKPDALFLCGLAPLLESLSSSPSCHFAAAGVRPAEGRTQTSKTPTSRLQGRSSLKIVHGVTLPRSPARDQLPCDPLPCQPAEWPSAAWRP